MEVKNLTISKEYLEKIRRFTAIKPTDEFVYVPKAFRELPEALRPKFTLRRISGEEVLKFSDEIRGFSTFEGTGHANVKVNAGELLIITCKAGVIKWENYFDSKGEIIPYDKSLANLPPYLIEELSNVIATGDLSEEEVLGLK